MTDQSLFHESVLKKEVCQNLLTPQTRAVFDGTLGLGGHAEMILSHFPSIEFYAGTDLDPQHLKFAQQRLQPWKEKLHLFRQNFSTLGPLLTKTEVPRPLVILLDLGLCSNQLDDPKKGFSFRAEGPLNMSFSPENEESAEHLLNQSSLSTLIQIFREFGEEPRSEKIARAIESRRSEKPIKTTQELRNIIESVTHQKEHKKTLMRIFQSLRIATNQELQHLEKTLNDSLQVMQAGDRIGVMSFHSLEDRLVKQFFKKNATPQTRPSDFSLHEIVRPAKLKLYTKKPIVPSTEEISHNPRSRSVKFRIAEKISH
jgi:16S rRNA (cytosine1402-N4)-methyltransferase